VGYQWPQDFDKLMRNFLEPRSIAVIGATEGAGYGGRMIDNLLNGGFRGKVFPVNPRRSEVKGLPCYPSVLQVEGEVDLAVIVIPARAVLDALQQCKEKGIRSVVIISAGFSERDGQAGIDRQKQLRQFTMDHGMFICGPNCLGVSNVSEKIHANAGSGIANLLPEPGPIGVVSQSGAMAFGPILAKAKDRGVRLKYIASTGNEANLESADFIRFILDDPDVRVIAAFIEGFKEGEKIKTVADLALDRKKPIILMKMGRTEAGGRAALTHTAALTGSFKVHDGFFRQKGIVRVNDYDELCEVANLFSKGKFPKGDGVGIISHSGGICTFLSDECSSEGFHVPRLSKDTTGKIEQILQGWGSCENPLDLTGFARGPQFPEILRSVINDPNVDSVILATRGDKEYAENVIKAAGETDKPLLFVWTHSEFDSEGLPALRAGGMPVFISPVKCIKALKHLRNYYKIVQNHHDPGREKVPPSSLPSSDPRIEQVRAFLSQESSETMTEGRCREILAPLGLPFSSSIVCQSIQKARTTARELEYPVVLKMDSPQILHKTECQGVRLNIQEENELTKAFDDMIVCWRSLDPPVTLNGIMVQKMITGGIELILGVSDDPLFGPILMLGWGGIFVEALEIGAWRVCPIGQQDAREMIHEIPGLTKILSGIRGRPPLDGQALVDVMVRVSFIACALKDLVSSMDFNPIKVLPEGKGVKLLDSRMVLRSTKTLLRSNT